MNNISKLRKDNGIGQSALAKNAGISQAYVSLLENSERLDVALNKARALVSAFNRLGVACLLDDVFPGPNAD